MTPIRILLNDLVDKRLWPVALLLVVALVAIPVLVGGSSASSDASDLDPVAAGSGPVAAATPAVELVGPPSVRSRPGKVRDPFRRKQAKPAAAAEKSAAPAASASSKPSSTSSPTSSAGGSQGGAAAPAPATAPPAAPVPTVAKRSYYETTARVTGYKADYEHPLDRLAVVGGKRSPAAQYIGATRGGAYAIFLLGPTATADGDVGACVVADPCRAIGLRKGEALEITVAGPGARVRGYTLEVTGLRRVTLMSEAAAQAERDAVAQDGRKVLRAMAEDLPTLGALGRLRYGPATGTVALVGVG